MIRSVFSACRRNKQPEQLNAGGVCGSVRGNLPYRQCHHTTISANNQTAGKCRKNPADRFSGIFSRYLRIPHFFTSGHGLRETNLSHMKTHVSASKTFYFGSGCFSAGRTRIFIQGNHSPSGLKKEAPTQKDNNCAGHITLFSGQFSQHHTSSPKGNGRFRIIYLSIQTA
ncbi:MAG: hypothetical protein IJL32_05270 [Oscillospiraceae bacterium]|nr:hypothetical protein [Oscillospiraceae bacterium]